MSTASSDSNPMFLLLESGTRINVSEVKWIKLLKPHQDGVAIAHFGGGYSINLTEKDLSAFDVLVQVVRHAE